MVKAPFRIDAQFKRPVFLPSSSVFTFASHLSTDDYKFNVTEEKSGAPQLIGSITSKSR